MANYNGHVYAGSANGPDGPTDMARYDFEFYKEGLGAEVFTDAGNGEFHMLDDQDNLDSTDKSIRKMCVSSYSNRLFIGTETISVPKFSSTTRATIRGKRSNRPGTIASWPFPNVLI